MRRRPIIDAPGLPVIKTRTAVVYFDEVEIAPGAVALIRERAGGPALFRGGEEYVRP